MPRDSKKSKQDNAGSSNAKSTQLIDYVEKLVSFNEQQVAVKSEFAEQFDEKMEEVSTKLELKMTELIGSIEAKLNRLVGQLAPANQDATATGLALTRALDNRADNGNGSNEEEASGLSDWDRRKQQILSDYGVQSDAPRQLKPGPGTMDAAANPNEPIMVEVPPIVSAENDEDMEALHDSIESISAIEVDSEAVTDLKEQLTSKLRDAEVELSINRAKLSQQWAALEQRQYELSQRESNLEHKYGDATDTSKQGRGGKQKFLDRLSRHLSRRDDDQE